MVGSLNPWRSVCAPVPLVCVAACSVWFDKTRYEAPCVQFAVDDESIVADPQGAFPGEPFVLRWKERYVQATTTPAQFDEVMQSVALVDPADGTALLTVQSRQVPKPPEAFAGGRDASIDFSEFATQPAFQFRDYRFRVELHPLEGEDIECDADPSFDSVGEYDLTLPCDCAGQYSYGLRVENARAEPASPIPLGAAVTLRWTTVFDGVACAGAAPLMSPDLQASVVVVGPATDYGPLLVDVPALPLGGASDVTVPLEDVLGTALPLGVYEATVLLDPSQTFPDCASQGAANPFDNAGVFTFEIVR